MADEPALGPVDFILVRFPGSRMTGGGLEHLADLHDRGIITVLDLMAVQREADGSVVIVDVSDVDSDGELDLTILEGAPSGMLDEDDANQAAELIEPGDTAALLVYENTWARPLVSALHAGGAELISSGRIPADELMQTLDALEASV